MLRDVIIVVLARVQHEDEHTGLVIRGRLLTIQKETLQLRGTESMLTERESWDSIGANQRIMLMCDENRIGQQCFFCLNLKWLDCLQELEL